MLDTLTRNQPDTSAYPSQGVRIGVNQHPQAVGGHRVRFSFDPTVAQVLRRGLSFPRLHLDGTMVNGLRIWCAEEGYYSPIQSNSGGWSFAVPTRKVRAREMPIHVMEVDFEWQLDDTGPVLLVPRLPDVLLPEPVIDKLPNSQVDPETRHDRAEQRLQRDMRKLYEEAAALDNEPGGGPESRGVPTHPQDPPPAPGGTLAALGGTLAVPPPAPSAPAQDLKAALQMVNELVDHLGAEVVLSIDANGHVQAKRRVVQFVDL